MKGPIKGTPFSVVIGCAASGARAADDERLAATKAGAVVVNTMPMLRAGELSKIVDKAEIALALTDSRIADELVACAKTSRFLKQVVNFDGTSNHDAELDRVALNKPVKFDAVKTGRDDVALLIFIGVGVRGFRSRETVGFCLRKFMVERNIKSAHAVEIK